MKNLIIALNIVLIFTFCTNNTTENKDNLVDRNIALIRENDSLKKLLDAQINDTTLVESTKRTDEAQKSENVQGRHPITLQWISWDKHGNVDVMPLEDGWYTISGSQTSDNGKDYLKIEGKIRRVSTKELEFNGTIETLVSSNNQGEVCVKEGKQIFLAKGNRKYFRLQNMTNCEGGMLVDYVDIYPGSSSLLD